MSKPFTDFCIVCGDRKPPGAKGHGQHAYICSKECVREMHSHHKPNPLKEKRDD